MILGNADIIKKLRSVFKVITDEATHNEQFAANIATALGLIDKKAKPTATKKSNRRDPAVLNPIKLITEDEKTLEKRLNELSDKELKDIIAEFALDPAHVASRWRKKEKFVALIMDMSRQWATKGNAFR